MEPGAGVSSVAGGSRGRERAPAVEEYFKGQDANGRESVRPLGRGVGGRDGTLESFCSYVNPARVSGAKALKLT